MRASLRHGTLSLPKVYLYTPTMIGVFPNKIWSNDRQLICLGWSHKRLLVTAQYRPATQPDCNVYIWRGCIRARTVWYITLKLKYIRSNNAIGYLKIIKINYHNRQQIHRIAYILGMVSMTISLHISGKLLTWTPYSTCRHDCPLVILMQDNML